MHDLTAPQVRTAVRRYLRKHDITAAALARQMGLHRATVRRVVSGDAEPSFRFRELAARLGVGDA